MVAIGKPDGGFFKIGFVHEFLRFGGRQARSGHEGRLLRSTAGQHGGIGTAKTANEHAVVGKKRRGSRPRLQRHVQTERGGGCEGLRGGSVRTIGTAQLARSSGGLGVLLAFPPLLRHLRFDLVDFFERDGPLVGRGHAALKKRGARSRVLFAVALKHFALAQFAQLIELAAAHKIVAALALNHLLEHLLAVLALFVRLDGVKLRPVDRGIAHKPHHLRQQSTSGGFFFGHGRGGRVRIGFIGWWLFQSPNIFCLSSRRC